MDYTFSPWNSPGQSTGVSALASFLPKKSQDWKIKELNNGKVKVKVSQSCPTLCDAMDSIVHGILQARILEWHTSFPSLGYLPNRGIEPRSPALRVDSLPDEPQGKPKQWQQHIKFIMTLFAGY